MRRNLNVSDLKQYLYCPRVVWFRYCQPVHRPVTYKMQDGKSRGEHVAELEQRRSLKAYGLHTAHRSFEVWLDSDQLGLCGKVDMLIDTGSERVPVEFKDAQRVATNHRCQLAAYALLLEEVPGPAGAAGIRVPGAFEDGTRSRHHAGNPGTGGPEPE
jgi:CRISPR-associated exonuclease Cas4